MPNRTAGFWQAIEAVPGWAAVDAEWKVRFANDYGMAKAFLRPNGKLASSHPCTIPRGCGCEHDVIDHGGDDIVAVCRCERGCETFRLRPSDIVVYELNREALDAALASVLGLIKETDAGTDLHGTTRIGIYSPYAGYRFPVYLVIQLEPDHFNEVVDGLLGRNDAPFILLAPTRDLCTAKAEKRLTDRRSGFLPLSESVSIGDRGQLRLVHPLDELLSQFRAANLPSPKEEGAKTFFPSPPDATWSDVSIRFRDGDTVSIKVKSVGGMFNYTQMGMANKRNGNRTVQWELLRVFAEGRGVLDWSSKGADWRNKKRRELLAANLRDFFRIEGDPFRLTDDRKGWRTRFLIFPVE